MGINEEKVIHLSMTTISFYARLECDELLMDNQYESRTSSTNDLDILLNYNRYMYTIYKYTTYT